MIKASEAKAITQSYQTEMEIFGIDIAHEKLSTIESVIRMHANDGESMCDVFILRLFDSKDAIARETYIREIKRILSINGFDTTFNTESKVLRIQW